MDMCDGQIIERIDEALKHVKEASQLNGFALEGKIRLIKRRILKSKRVRF
jgi:hypothetical protein